MKTKKTGEESRFGQMDRGMMVFGKMGWLMGTED
jgi:hypothetical protein